MSPTTEDHSQTREIPGTVRLFAENGELLQSTVELIPKPSDDPEDPLNWSPRRKTVNLSCLIFYTFAVAVSATSLYSIYGPLSDAIGLTLDELNVGAGYSYWAIGISSCIIQPCAIAFGKRPIFILAALSGGLLFIWTNYISSNSLWILSRLLIGFSGGPSFSLVEIAITDVFFLHQRAFPLGLYVFVLYVGALVGPLLSGYIYEGMGWKAVVWFTTGLSLLATLVMVFGFEETNFTREEPSVALEVVPGSNHSLARLEGDRSSHGISLVPDTSVDESDSKSKDRNQDAVMVQPVAQRWIWPRVWQRSKVSPHAFGIIKRGIVQPFALMRLPIILWCGVMYGVYQVFFNLFGFLSSGVLTAPPYNFGTGATGLTFLSPLLGTIPSAIWGGWLCNIYSLRQARKNHGISKAEHKLKLYIIPTVLAPIGLLMMGLGPFYGAHWIVYVAGECILNLAGPLATLLIIAYAFDVFHSIDPDDSQGPKAAAQDCAPYLTAIIFIGMSVTFAFGYAITPWSFLWSFKLFGITAAIGVTALNASVLLIVWYGKTLRQNGEGYYRKVINW
ncbi:uncharacterized protein I303_105212 [Kwoniella dejecticola CBS 10117]|uniref:Major facilitator superfamily (MFS) profile domain-containing protein n=1 Tax=Kwoniella dejecticola CBS 10117 TaxID=1296121 RepID=A0A1A6A349_9TREE|nr:uncharacterized protein I303_05341 [Kwoniella dejecticola CBS 10117]OBR84483.1 hypothetical protein I303_05341 [Kwoniella dejecticola CBS 10117]